MTADDPDLPALPAPYIERQAVVVGVASLVAFINLGLALGTSFGWLTLSTDQAVQLGLFITALAGIVGAALRAKVWAPASVAELVAREP